MGDIIEVPPGEVDSTGGSSSDVVDVDVDDDDDEFRVKFAGEEFATAIGPV